MHRSIWRRLLWRWTYNPDIVSPQQLKEAVMKIGFDLIIDEDNSVQEQEEAEQSYYGQLTAEDYRCLDFCFTGSCLWGCF